MSKIDLSRLSLLSAAMGGTAIQVIKDCGPVADLVASGSCGWIAPTATVAGAVAGLALNRIAAAMDKRKELQEATRDLLTNRDIAHVQALAVAARLRRFAEACEVAGQKKEKKRLLALANAASEWWLAVVADPVREAGAALQDVEIVGRLTPYLTGTPTVVISAALWEEILREADRQTKGADKLEAEFVAMLAGKIAGDFAHDLVESLKTNFAQGGKAYAAVSLRFFAEILGGVNDNKAALAELKPVLTQVPDLLRTLAAATDALRQAGSLSLEVARSIEAADRALSHISRGMNELLKAAAETKVTLGNIQAGVELLVEAHAQPKSPAALLCRADISRILKYAPVELIGRETETALLADSWAKAVRAEKGRAHVVVVVALGGEGKTSLVAKWAADLAAQDWPGCDAVFAWSFYSQGTRETVAPDSDLFLKAALTFFGGDQDKALAASSAGAHEKATRLARIVGQRRCLLILDGLEPLQHPPSSTAFPPGELKDKALAKLLGDLAATSHGLCVVTTRYALPDLRAFLGQTVREEKLTRLARAAGVLLLKAHGVTGSDRPNLPHTDDAGKKEMLSEFEKLVEDVDGHALTLHLMGSFLKRFFLGKIHCRDRVTFAKADQKTDNGHAFRAMAAYEKWLADGSEEARREL
ncbi:MAG: hypothetical protein RLZZ15_2535, partial [Verrucomicrobiota bacterium]